MLQDFLITLNSDWSETNMSLIVLVDLLAFDEACVLLFNVYVFYLTLVAEFVVIIV